MGHQDHTSMGEAREAFLTTQWSLIEHIKAGQDRDKILIGFLLKQYWKPVYCYLRRKGYDNEQAKDLTQGFFHDVVLNRDLVGRADPARGRFRSFLLHALNQFVTRQTLRDRARKRIPQEKMVSWEMVDLPDLPQSVTDASDEHVYHYAWLSSLLERVLGQVKTECDEQGMEPHWALFHERVVRPILEGQPAPSLADLCQTHGIEDIKKASNMIITVKRRFRAALMHHVRTTVLSQADASDELRELLLFLPKSAQHLT